MEPSFDLDLGLVNLQSDLSYVLPNLAGSTADALFAGNAFWTGVSTAQLSIGDASLPMAAVAMFSTAYHRKLPIEFKLETGVSQSMDFDFKLGLTALLGAELDLGGKAVQEVSGLTCKGIYWEGKHYLNEAYPFTPGSEIPTNTTASAILEYWPYLINVVGEIVKEILADVAAGEALVVQLGDLAQGGQAVFDGTFDAAGQFVGGYLDGLGDVVGGTASIRGSDSKSIHTQADEPQYLPLAGASNYVYGIGGVYYLNASNTTLVGSGTLTVQYTDKMAEGLDENGFRLYRQETNETWNLVGTSFAYPQSNMVVGVITQLGCYAVGPAMPGGEITMLAPTSPVAIDGVSTAEIVLTNLVLNTGEPATQNWLYTVVPEGVEILTGDADTNRLGHQVVATNAMAVLAVRALQNATWARISVQSIAGAAAGAVLVAVADSNVPLPVVSLSVTAGESRIWAHWPAVTNQDVAGYRVYYRCGAAGPPYDGLARVEGENSPFDIVTTNVVTVHGVFKQTASPFSKNEFLEV